LFIHPLKSRKEGVLLLSILFMLRHLFLKSLKVFKKTKQKIKLNIIFLLIRKTENSTRTDKSDRSSSRKK